MKHLNVTGAGKVTIGKMSIISADAKIIFSKPGSIIVGDYCSIGPGVKIVCSGGDVKIGDWTTLHDNCLVLSGKHVTIDQHCWFGQNCIIDGTGGLRIGRGVRVGMYSQIWSHVAAGEQIEGCTLYGEREVVLEDNVWLVGSCIVASGVTVGNRTVALIGSNITKSIPANSTIAGTPATSKPNLSFYKEITLDEKWELLIGWLRAAAEPLNFSSHFIGSEFLEVKSSQDEGTLVFVRSKDNAVTARRDQPNSTVCCVEDKSYNKKFSLLEGRVLKFLSGNKARFYSK